MQATKEHIKIETFKNLFTEVQKNDPGYFQRFSEELEKTAQKLNVVRKANMVITAKEYFVRLELLLEEHLKNFTSQSRTKLIRAIHTEFLLWVSNYQYMTYIQRLVGFEDIVDKIKKN